jgi:hypothetical protein
MKISHILLGLLATTVHATITSDENIRQHIPPRLLTQDADDLIKQLVAAAKEVANANGQTNITPNVDREKIKNDARNLGNSFVLEDLQKQQDFAYYVYPYFCDPPNWYDVLSVYAPMRDPYAIKYWLSRSGSPPYTLAQYNEAINQVYKMYAAQQAARWKETQEQVTVVNNWPPAGKCIPLASITATTVVPGTKAGTTTISSGGRYHVEITKVPVSTNTIPGLSAGTRTLVNSQGNFYNEVVVVPASTTTVPGHTAGTATLTDADGGFYEVVTLVPVSTITVPGLVTGTETLVNRNGSFYEQVTVVPTSTTVVPGHIVGTATIRNSDGGFYERVTSVPVSTNTVPGLIPGTATLVNHNGSFYEQVTVVPTSTTVVPGHTAGTETLRNTDGGFYVRATVIPGSTTVVPGHTAGTATLQYTNGSFYEVVTNVPVSTNIVLGLTAGTETLIDSKGNFYEQVTRTVVSTNTVLGESSGTETLTNPHGDFYEQVTSVSSPPIFSTRSSGSIVSTNIVPGYREGTEILTGTNGNLFVQVTRTPISTNTVSGSIVGTEILINSDGDFFEQVTSIQASFIVDATSSASASTDSFSSTGSTSSTGVPSLTRISGTFTVFATKDSSPSAFVATTISFGHSKVAETIRDTTGDAMEQATNTPFSTSSLVGSVIDTEILTKSNGDVSIPVPTAANTKSSATSSTDIITVVPDSVHFGSTKEVKSPTDTISSSFVHETGAPVATKTSTGITVAIEIHASPSCVQYKQTTGFPKVASTMAISSNSVVSALVAPRPTTHTSLRNSEDEFTGLSTSVNVSKNMVSTVSGPNESQTSKGPGDGSISVGGVPLSAQPPGLEFPLQANSASRLAIGAVLVLPMALTLL